jgi:hypothetical protein
MSDVIGWVIIAAWLAVPLMLIVMAVRFTLSRRPLEKKYAIRSGGIGGGFDAVWSPSAHDADAERDRQSERTAPAPTADDPPWTIDGDHIRIKL